jgi:D-amino-acid oxidase
MSRLKALTSADVLVNSSGFSARELANDEQVYGVRGQTMFVKCEGAENEALLNQATLHQGSHYTYAIPRSSDGDIIIGGVSQPANTQTTRDRSLRSDIVRRVNKVTGGKFEWVDLEKHGEDIVGFRPAREGRLRVEREGDVVHAYGVGGFGIMYAFGVAEKARGLIEKEMARL